MRTDPIVPILSVRNHGYGPNHDSTTGQLILPDHLRSDGRDTAASER
jgi:hypothetical protein